MTQPLRLLAMICLLNLLSCSSTARDADNDGDQGGDTASDTADTMNGDGGTDSDSGADSDTDTNPPVDPNAAHLTGQVVAPEGTIPISGALVYLTSVDPPAIPDGVHCDKCVEMDAGTPHTFTNPDGTFDLPVSWSSGEYKLVVQKGWFRRVRPYTFDYEVKDQPVDIALTTLPAKMDKANGDDIPKMAVLVGAWDAIEVSLAKLGLADINNVLIGPKVKNASFDLFNSTLTLLNNAATLNKYHIVFIPCSFSSGTTCDTSVATQTSQKNNIRNWVKAGGRLYVTDYSYEFIRQIFADYITWEGQTPAIGSACQQGSYSVPANPLDPGLAAWLEAMGLSDFDVEANWTTISSTSTVEGLNADSQPELITPTVWVEALKNDGPHPSTVSFPYACGRALFSTYHTEGGGEDEMLVQEKALLYVLLEVGVCINPPGVE